MYRHSHMWAVNAVKSTTTKDELCCCNVTLSVVAQCFSMLLFHAFVLGVGPHTAALQQHMTVLT